MLTFALALNHSITVPEGAVELATFLDRVAVDAGYLALRDEGGSGGDDGDDGNDGHDWGATDGLSPRGNTDLKIKV